LKASYFQAAGKPIPPDELRSEKARSFAIALTLLNYVELLECRHDKGSGQDIVVFEAEVELGQENKHDIRKKEVLSVHFDPSDRKLPRIFALRGDFPQVPHLVLNEKGAPRELCVYEEGFAVENLRWTAVDLVKRIRGWLALTAKGLLHAQDQPLEPLLFSSPYTLVVPPDFMTQEKQNDTEFLVVSKIIENPRRSVVIAGYRDPINPPEKLEMVATLIFGAPQPHGIIHHRPETLKDVHNFAESAGIDLVGELRKRIYKWHTEKIHNDLYSARLAIVLVLPKTRDESGKVESLEEIGFITGPSVIEIGKDIGIWEKQEGFLAGLLPVATERIGVHTEVIQITVMRAFSKELAAVQNGDPKPANNRIAAVGMGALGSQLFLNLARAGYGEWTLIDDDILFPHNLARHALMGSAIGVGKANALSIIANSMLAGKPIAKALPANIIDPEKDMIEPLRLSLEKADIILDLSASVPVARHIARDVVSEARRISLFLNPAGTDLVMLAEDEKRSITLDCLEMQYYRQLVQNSSLEDHLRQPTGRMRYGNTCRDINITLPQDLVALHASIGSRALRNIVDDGNASITIWRADPDTGEVKRIKVQVEKPQETTLAGWTLCTDQHLMNKIREARGKLLPKETGGVLLGSFEIQRRIIYLMDTLLSPPDSIEKPNAYIRGCQGLKKQTERIMEITRGNLEYVGEWHSHPPGCSSRLSVMDEKALEHLQSFMLAEGLPVVMMIVGDEEQMLHVGGNP